MLMWLNPTPSFMVKTPCIKLILRTDNNNKKYMEDWIERLKNVQNREHFESAQYHDYHFSGMYNWYSHSHARPTYSNLH